MDSSDEESREIYSRHQKWRPSSSFNSITFAWLSPLLKLGKSKEQLELEDLLRFPLPSSCKAEDVWDSFYKYWSLEKEKKSLSKCLFQAYWVDFAYAGLLKFLHDCCQFVGPFVLRALIQFLRDESANFVDGLWLTLAVTLSQTVMTVSLRHYNFKCNLTGLRMRTAIVLAIHRKALVLSCGEKQRLTSGNIVNLESVDAQRIQDLPTYVHAVWFSFIQIIISLYFLWGQLGISSLGGFAVILLSLPINHMIAYRMGKLQKKVMTARDERVEMTNEVLKGMKGIKIQAWEHSFQSRIVKLRENELRRLKKCRYFAIVFEIY
jgi:ABC-type multidrug transport system fused ATPase/permease subunit